MVEWTANMNVMNIPWNLQARSPLHVEFRKGNMVLHQYRHRVEPVKIRFPTDKTDVELAEIKASTSLFMTLYTEALDQSYLVRAKTHWDGMSSSVGHQPQISQVPVWLMQRPVLIPLPEGVGSCRIQSSSSLHRMPVTPTLPSWC